MNPLSGLPIQEDKRADSETMWVISTPCGIRRACAILPIDSSKGCEQGISVRVHNEVWNREAKAFTVIVTNSELDWRQCCILAGEVLC